MNPVSNNPLRGVTPVAPSTPPTRPAGEGGFADALRSQLEQVAQLQQEAEQGVQRLVTGQSDNLTEVLASARKAEVAFNLLMEMRNKLVDAYNELKQLRV